MATSPFLRSVMTGCAAIGLAASVILLSTTPASAATVINGPVDLGTAATYGVLGASAVTNTGPTVVNGDLGVSPGTSITGFGPADGIVNGTVHQTDAAAAQAQRDTTTAYDVAAGLTPTRTGITELNGLSLTPGVYSGGALSLANTGALTLAGSANSVWVFQAASTLTIGSGTRITITGGASSCNVFWQVGSSATVGTGAQFQGTVLAQQSVTATTGATVVGRLLARTGAVTLDTNTITASSGCPTPGTPSETTAPTITSGTPPTATAGTPYSYTVTATGTPAPTYTAVGLPAGLTLNGTTGVVSGTPTAPGTSRVTITASNGTSPNATTVVTITVRPTAPASTPPSAAPTTPAGNSTAVAVGSGSGSGGELAFTGSDPTVPLGIAGALLAAGIALTVVVRQSGPARHRQVRAANRRR
ncbi:Putative Ig domain-containing protein [Curtobacterium sp. UNCCL20]|uniref:ice-binding family protein n=1 Tax=Curtobacterium sp. UNCCL20 TaxID=1502773 RepID=UPI000887243F|nr:ice-binding family protein [Curtobacterium sp. UNCCL20]SDR02974.1 Putative Ig domain-containing protein [Curtobacterium sp. UNCCL20]